MIRRDLIASAIIFVMLVALVQTTYGQEGRTATSVRLAWLVTAGEGYVDRPVVESAIAYDLTAGSQERPVISVTGSAGVAIGDAFAEVTLWSFRTAGGVEVRFPLKRLQLTPFLQTGYLTAIKEDERSGLYSRFGFGIRVAGKGAFRYSFDPISVTRLPVSDQTIDTKSRYGIEIGVIRAIWQF
ncbi:MAG: hypothetical protein HKN43_01320 [Rhodothermales bacterium]|nr:hypothetical protein [Rhodothermales bacterium]